MTTIGVLGSVDDRRTVGFVAAARDAGWQVVVVPWLDLCTAPPAAVDALGASDLVRIDSPGEDPEVTQALTRGPVAPTFGCIPDLGRWRAGLAEALAHLAALDPTRLLAGPDDLVVAFDKAATHARLAAAGVPVPGGLPGGPFHRWDEIVDAIGRAGWRRAFLKPCAGSSGVGVVAVAGFPTPQRPDRVDATTSMRRTDDGIVSELRQRPVRAVAELAELVEHVGTGGIHVEAWFPRAAVDDRVLDLRVLVIGGEARHVVVRTSGGPITNLHLGNRRGDVDAVRDRVGPAWSEVGRVAEAAAACFPTMLHVGVDLLLGNRWDRVVVAEVNAFGDLLPGVLDRGRTTFEAELDAIAAGWMPASVQDLEHAR